MSVIPPANSAAAGLPPSIRNFSGWIALATLVLLLAVSGVAVSRKGERPKAVAYDSEMTELETAVNMREVGRQFGTKNSSEDLNHKTDEMLVPLVSDLVDAKDKNSRAALIYAAARTEQGKKVSTTDIPALIKSKAPEDNLVGEVYTSSVMSLGRAKEISLALPKDPSIYNIVRIHAFERAGDKSARARFAEPQKAFKAAIAFMALATLMGASLLVWSMYSAYRNQGLIRPLGFPTVLQGAIDADRFALLAAILLVGVFVAQLVVEIVAKNHLQEWATGLLTSLAVVLSTVILIRLRVIGHVVTLLQIGIRKQPLRPLILWGLAGFIAELPVSMLLLEIGSKVFFFLPPPEHPATTVLEHNHNILPVISIFVYGVLVAPVVEEIIFRGLLFPALHRITGSVVTAALSSGMMFAMIHPQGPIMWLALANVGVMSSVLFYHTRSLVPSFVMHATHNLTLLVLTLLISPG